MAHDRTINTSQLENAADARAFVLSRNPDKAMQEMMETIDALRVVYAEETTALKNSDTKAFSALQDRKIAAARNYRDGVEQIVARREEFKNINPALRKKLTGAHEDFSRLSVENLAALDRMRRAVSRLGERIMAAARESVRQESPNYSRSGEFYKKQRTVSIGVSESA